jgi:hypothetical protein
MTQIATPPTTVYGVDCGGWGMSTAIKILTPSCIINIILAYGAEFLITRLMLMMVRRTYTLYRTLS